MDGILSNIQRFSMHDGPGVRTTVFFKGCPLRCLWCHNPETYRFGQELRWDREACIGCASCVSACAHGALTAAPNGLAHEERACARCFACVSACPAGALAVAGQRMSVEQVVGEALRDRGMYERSGGGVTLSGGEATAQPEFCAGLLDALHVRGVHTALDTCGFCAPDVFADLARRADLILFDLKHADPAQHKALTGQDNALILRNLDALDAMGARVEVRIPLIPTFNDERNLLATAEIIRRHDCVTRAVVLGYHPLGQTKIYDFDQHGRDLGIDRPAAADVRAWAEQLQAASGRPAAAR